MEETPSSMGEPAPSEAGPLPSSPPSSGTSIQGANEPDDLPEEEAPREIEVDAAKELDRIHEANMFPGPSFDDGFELPDFGNYGMGEPAQRQASPVSAYQPIGSPQIQRNDPPVPNRRDLKTLEDLYDAYPDIGDGNTYLRVERKHPTRFSGQFIAGFIEDLHQQISMSDFVQRYGGGTYTVSVLGPGRGTTMDGDGRYQTRTLTDITVKAPGMPVIAGANGDDMAANWDRNVHVGRSDRLEMKRMEFENDHLKRVERREEQLRRQLEATRSQDPAIIDRLAQLAEKRALDTKESSQAIIADQRQELHRLREVIENLQQRLNDERNSKVALQTEFAQKLREEETRQVRELKMQHEQTVSNLRETQSEQIERMQREHERRISELTERQQRELTDLRNSEARERERLRDDANRREKGLQDDFNRREAAFRDRENSIKEDYARREESLRRDYELRIQQMERSNKRDMDMIRSAESNNTSLAQQTANMQISLMQQRIQQLESDLSAAHAEASETRRELEKHTNKPLLQQVEETRQIGDALGLFGKSEEDFNWQKGLFNTLKDVVNKAPEIAKGFGEAREQNRAAVAHAQRQAMLAQQRAAAQQRGLPAPTMAPGMVNAPPSPRPQPQRGGSPHPSDGRFSPTPAPGMGGSWDSGPSDPFAGGDMPPAHQGPPPQEPKEVADDSFTMAGADATEPWSTEEGASQAEPHETVQPQQSHPVASPGADQGQQSVQPEPQQPQSNFDFSPEQLEEFALRLNEAIEGGLIEPPTFATGFIDQVGAQNTLTLMENISSEDFIQAISSTPNGAKLAIVTRRGQKYVEELWQHAKAQASAALG